LLNEAAMISHFRTSGRLAGALAVLIGLSAPAGAAPTEIDEQHTASRLAVADFAGILRIEAHDGPGIRLLLRGSAEALAGITREVRADTLHVAAGGAGQPVTPVQGVTVMSVGNNTVITQAGGIGNFVIGSSGRNGRSRVMVNGVPVQADSQEPTELLVRVPRGTPLELSGLVGQVSVDDVDGWVGLELRSGRARIDRVKGGTLALAGSGRIEVASATGNLTLTVHGAGNLEIARAELDDLDVTVAGAGQVTVAGVAERASVWVSGVSQVSIDEVRTRPEVEAAGVSRISIGNW
jgi:hypothetical protein